MTTAMPALHLNDFKELKGHVVLFGGTFDPPQRAHHKIAEVVERLFDPVTVVFMPAARNPHKTQLPLASFEDRFTMLMLLVGQSSRWKVSRYEIDRPSVGPSYTVDTVKQIKAKLTPGVRLSMVLGSDSFRNLPGWKDWEVLVGILDTVIVVPRPGMEGYQGELEKILPPQQRVKLKLLPAASVALSVSSTEVRKRLLEGEPVDDLVPPGVLDYIKRKNLYLTL